MHSRLSGASLLLALLLAPVAASAQVTSTLPSYTGPFSFGGTTAEIGTFSFMLPPGQSIFSAMLTGSFGGPDPEVGTAPVDLFLDGILVAQCTLGEPCFRSRTPFSFTFNTSQLSMFEDGITTLTAAQTGPFVVRITDPMLTLNAPTNVVPEPVSMVLLGTGLAGVAAAARRRRGKAPVV